MRHRPVQSVPGTLQFTSRPLHDFTSHFDNSNLRFPSKGGAVRRENGIDQCSAVARRGTRIQFGSSGRGPPLGAPRPGRFEEAFRRFAPSSAAGLRRCNLFRSLRHQTRPLGLVRCNSRFSALARVGRPPVASSPLPDWPAMREPTSSGPAFPLCFRLIIKKHSLREQGRQIVLLIVLSTEYSWIFLEAAKLQRDQPQIC
jgi:hypothetical protein